MISILTSAPAKMIYSCALLLAMAAPCMAGAQTANIAYPAPRPFTYD